MPWIMSLRCSGLSSEDAATCSSLGPAPDAAGRLRGAPGAFDAGERASHELDPGSIGRSGLDQRAPRRRRLRAVAVLLGGEPEEVARLDVAGVERDRSFECALASAVTTPLAANTNASPSAGFALGRCRR